MEDNQAFNHKKAGTADRIAVVAELEHLLRHALRAAVTLSIEEKQEESFRFLVWAQQIKTMRRKYMGKHFADIDSKHWCLCKSAACLRQLAYEVETDDIDFLVEVDNLVDGIWGDALGKDLSDCTVCKEDKEIDSTAEPVL